MASQVREAQPRQPARQPGAGVCAGAAAGGGRAGGGAHCMRRYARIISSSASMGGCGFGRAEGREEGRVAAMRRGSEGWGWGVWRELKDIGSREMGGASIAMSGLGEEGTGPQGRPGLHCTALGREGPAWTLRAPVAGRACCTCRSTQAAQGVRTAPHCSQASDGISSQP